MANSRYDNIQYFDGSSFKIPEQIKVYDGSDWLDLGAKDSYSLKKLCVKDTNEFICATYYRNDVDIPKTVEIGKNKYGKVLRSDGKYANFDDWLTGFQWEMTAEIYKSTTLFCAYAKNQGDITNQAYFNVYADVNSNNKVRVRIQTRFHGYTVYDHKFVDSGPKGDYTGATSYAWNVGDKVNIKITNKAENGSFYVTVKRNGTKVVDDDKLNNYTASFQVGAPNYHIMGACITDDAGTRTTSGKALVHYFKVRTKKTDGTNYYSEFNFNNAANNATKVNSIGNYSGKIEFSGTKVYGDSYTEYIRQTI